MSMGGVGSPGAGASVLRLRKNVNNLSADELAAFRQAIATMMRLGDNRGYNYQAGIHGVPQFYCMHNVELWLAWHRAYLYFFELFLEDQGAGVTLPWWDWTSTSSHTDGMPSAYTDTIDPSGNSNPLLKASIQVMNPQPGWPTETSRNPDDPANLPSADDVNAILALTSWPDFWLQSVQPHNQVHVWVGGTMGVVPWSSYDPVFWAHHCMVDRLWYLWQVKNPGGGPDPATLAKPLPPFNVTVGDVMDIRRLGYGYASSEIVISGVS